MKYLYESDPDVIRNVQTIHQLHDKVEAAPTQEELTYVEVHETVPYSKRVEIKHITEDMVTRVNQHKVVQDDIIKKNAALRDQLLMLRKQLASTQKAALDEKVGYEEVLSQKNQRTQVVTEESLQLSTEKRFYEERLKIQSDVEKEIAMEKEQLKRLLE